MSVDDKIDSIYSNLDTLCLEYRFEEIDTFLSNINYEKEKVTYLVAYLTITLPFRLQLKKRKDLFENTFNRLMQDGKSAKDIHSLLRSLS